jgi:serine/threonine protein kinase
MPVRVKLKVTMVGSLGGDGLTEEVSAASFQRKLGDRPGEGEGEPRDALPVEGEVVGNHYRLVRTLGEGMFGRVYVAERTDVPEHRVAMKVVNRAVYGGRDVERELVMLAAATHPNIVELKDHGMTSTYVWLTMPLFEGETLAERLTRGPLSLREAYEIFVPVARGLEVLHARGLRHQDIKPDNIFLANFVGQLHPVLLDLGVAVEVNADFVAGTALYAAPEQVAALGGVGFEAPLSDKIDTYCLASTLLYALVGEENFPGAKARTPFDISKAYEVRSTEPLAEGTVAELEGEAREMLSDALSRWLTINPADRPTTGEIVGELEVLLEMERRAVTAETDRVSRQRQSLLRFRFALIAVGLAVLSAAVYVYSKRETIQLAGELQRVKAEGAARFNDLGNCNAAHEVTQRERRECETERKEETASHQNFVAGLQGDMARNEASLNEQLNAATAKVQTCEENAERDEAAWKEERASMETAFSDKERKWDEARVALEEERTALRTAKETCDANSDRLSKAESSCRQDLAACKAEGDIYSAPPTPRPTGTWPSPKPPAPPPPAPPPTEPYD